MFWPMAGILNLHATRSHARVANPKPLKKINEID